MHKGPTRESDGSVFLSLPDAVPHKPETPALDGIGYPRRRVFLGFFFCPLVAGLVAGLYQFVALLAHLASNPRLIGEVRGGELMLVPILAPLMAQLLFLLPALGLALTVMLLKVRRSPRACGVLALVGGSLAALWVLPLIALVVRHSGKVGFSDYQLELLVLFGLGALTCGLAALCFLPGRHLGSPVPESGVEERTAIIDT